MSLNDKEIPTSVNLFKGGKHYTLDLSIITPKLKDVFICMTVEFGKDQTPANMEKVEAKVKVTNQYRVEVHQEVYPIEKNFSLRLLTLHHCEKPYYNFD